MRDSIFWPRCSVDQPPFQTTRTRMRNSTFQIPQWHPEGGRSNILIHHLIAEFQWVSDVVIYITSFKKHRVSFAAGIWYYGQTTNDFHIFHRYHYVIYFPATLPDSLPLTGNFSSGQGGYSPITLQFDPFALTKLQKDSWFVRPHAVISINPGKCLEGAPLGWGKIKNHQALIYTLYIVGTLVFFSWATLWWCMFQKEQFKSKLPLSWKNIRRYLWFSSSSWWFQTLLYLMVTDSWGNGPISRAYPFIRLKPPVFFKLEEGRWWMKSCKVK